MGVSHSPHVNEREVIRKAEVVLASYRRHGVYDCVVGKGAVDNRQVPSEQKILWIVSWVIVDSASEWMVAQEL